MCVLEKKDGVRILHPRPLQLARQRVMPIFTKLLTVSNMTKNYSVISTIHSNAFRKLEIQRKNIITAVSLGEYQLEKGELNDTDVT